MMNERFLLSIERIKQIGGEELIKAPFLSYFKRTADFILMINECYQKIQKGFLKEASLDELQEMNYQMYGNIPQQEEH